MINNEILIGDIHAIYADKSEPNIDILSLGTASQRYHFYCPRCMALRRVRSYTSSGRRKMAPTGLAQIIHSFNILVDIHCLQCHYPAIVVGVVKELKTVMWNLIYLEPGDFATPNSPEGVKFYLDQAQKAHSMGANSATVAMYRAALEHVMHEIGYTNGMLGRKVSDLENQIANGTAPEQAKKLDPDVLRVLSQLGNASIHANDGKLHVQSVFSEDLISAFQIALLETLDVLFEEPVRAESRKAVLKAALDATRNP